MTFPALLVAVVFVAGVAWWRPAVQVAVVLAIVEGALRKWVFPEYAQWVYLAKDVLLLGAYVGFFLPRVLRRQRPGVRHAAAAPLVLLGLVGVVELLNPALPNLAVGLFGMRAYLLYAPLLYLVPAALGDTARMRRFALTLVVLGVVPLALGVAQFWSPPDSVLNRYAWDEERAPGVATFGEAGRVRITGTFSYISGHTAFLTLVAILGVALVVGERRRWVRWGLTGMLVLAGGNLFMTGSRGPFLVLGVAIPAVLLLSVPGTYRAWLPRLAAGGLALSAVAAGSVALFPDAVAAFVERASGTEDLADRLVGIVREPLWALSEAGLGGWGIGSTHQATAFLVTDWPEPPPAAEGEWERIILEVGPIGFGLVLLARFLVIRQAWRAWCRCPDRSARPLLASALVLVLTGLPGNLIFNHTASLFYWFMAGLSTAAGSASVYARR